jgi:hypothetical protein
MSDAGPFREAGIPHAPPPCPLAARPPRAAAPIARPEHGGPPRRWATAGPRAGTRAGRRATRRETGHAPGDGPRAGRPERIPGNGRGGSHQSLPLLSLVQFAVNPGLATLDFSVIAPKVARCFEVRLTTGPLAREGGIEP